MRNWILAVLTLFSLACSSSPKVPEGWKKVSIGEMTFFTPPNAEIKQLNHDEGGVVTVLMPGGGNSLQIKIGAGGSVFPMSTMLVDTKDQIGFQLKYKVGEEFRNNTTILSKRGRAVLSINYSNLTNDQANTMDSIINTISLKPPASSWQL